MLCYLFLQDSIKAFGFIIDVFHFQEKSAIKMPEGGENLDTSRIQDINTGSRIRVHQISSTFDSGCCSCQQKLSEA